LNEELGPERAPSCPTTENFHKIFVDYLFSFDMFPASFGEAGPGTGRGGMFWKNTIE
jgi:hypothetical protein